MCCSSQSCLDLNLGTLLKKFSIFSCALFLAQLCLADSSWVKGPAQVSLGEYGQLEIPGGYKFANPEVALVFLKSAPAGGHMLGIVMPDSELAAKAPTIAEWYIKFEYFDTGHVNDMAEWELKEDAILSSLGPRIKEINKARESRGQPQMAKVGWEVKPIYHSSQHSLEWALRGDGMAATDTVLDYTTRFLTRRGVLQAQATLFRGGNFGIDLIHEILATVNINKGQTYADFQPADKTAAGGLATFATAALGQPGQITALAGGETGGGMRIVWISFGLLGCVGLVGGGILAKKFRRQRVSVPEPVTETAAAAPPKPEPAKNGLNLNVARQLKLPKPAKAARNGSNGNGNGASHNGNGNPAKRKRMFNYHKFYTEMVLQGPSPMVADNYSAYDLEILRYHNGNSGNGNANGNGNGYPNGSSNGHAPAGDPNVMLTAHSELIASQRGLIEEQKRLIQDQARLLEEKSKLMAEKEQLLSRQAHLINLQS